MASRGVTGSDEVEYHGGMGGSLSPMLCCKVKEINLGRGEKEREKEIKEVEPMPVTMYRMSSMDKVTWRRAASVKTTVYIHFGEACCKIKL